METTGREKQKKEKFWKVSASQLSNNGFSETQINPVYLVSSETFLFHTLHLSPEHKKKFICDDPGK